VWWLGFDTAHLHDFSPGMRAELRRAGVVHHSLDETYKGLRYVICEVESLAKQLAEIER
jgi:hypothetical protein